MLEFPEVYDRDNPAFDAFLANPPFMGGQKITGNLGKPYRDCLVEHVADIQKGHWVRAGFDSSLPRRVR